MQHYFRIAAGVEAVAQALELLAEFGYSAEDIKGFRARGSVE